MTETPGRPPGAAARRAARAGELLSSTRTRLAATLVAVVALTGLLVVVGVRTVLLDQLDDRVRDSLVQEYEEFRRFLQLGRTPDGARVDGDPLEAARLFLARSVLERGETVLVVDRAGGLVQSGARSGDRLGDDAALLDRWRRLTASVLETVDTPAGEAVALAVPIRRGADWEATFVVARFTRDDRQRVETALRVVMAFTGASVLLVAGVAWWLAGRVLRPLRLMTRTAERISREDLSGRLDDPGGNGETAVLVRTFNRMMDRLEGALDSQQAFLADVGHDLRTPITIIRGHLDQLAAGMVPEDERDGVLELLQDEVGRMGRLVEDLVLIARAQRPDFLHLGPVDLADLALGVQQRAAAIPGPDWRAHPGVGVVTADEGRLMQAALNLVTNAARYSPPGAPIVVGTALRGSDALLWVADSGPGVPDEQRAQIFRRHVSGPDRSDGGSGLGLAIARAIAEAHGGSLDLEPYDGRGATFTIRIPAEPGTAPGRSDR
ncbi:MAG TPA: HAMP domain-containing sensor histidine kinase [Miltoncostaeaceae bacterium]|nr:HAMP domain-containing sensor histidine kinase [Miltoncostaeaceae bacterium]